MDLLFQAIVIGAIQGLTEFLPVSSSAHLIVIPQLLGWDDPFLNSATFDVMLHAGTLVALLVYFWRDVVRLVGAGWAALRERTVADDPDRRLALLLVVSIIPAALLGVALESFFDTYFRDNLLLIPVIMVIGALFLWAADHIGRGVRDLDAARLQDAVVIGGAQALALFPGTSRSGVTIATGLFLGLRREAAARFAFLMGIPVIGGATLWKMRGLASAGLSGADLVTMLAGMVSAALFGLLAIGFLLRYLRTNGLGIFVAYRLVFAVVVGAILLVSMRPMDVMKRLRQQAIRDLLGQRDVRTQQELVAALRDRGFRATQATVSRDVAELGLVKRGVRGTQAYALPNCTDDREQTGEDRLGVLLQDLPVELRPAGLLLVLRAVPGSAHAIAAAVDRCRWPEVVGSIGGDDTVFLAFADRAALQRIRQRLTRLARA